MQGSWQLVAAMMLFLSLVALFLAEFFLMFTGGWTNPKIYYTAYPAAIMTSMILSGTSSDFTTANAFFVVVAMLFGVIMMIFYLNEWAATGNPWYGQLVSTDIPILISAGGVNNITVTNTVPLAADIELKPGIQIVQAITMFWNGTFVLIVLGWLIWSRVRQDQRLEETLSSVRDKYINDRPTKFPGYWKVPYLPAIFVPSLLIVLLALTMVIMSLIWATLGQTALQSTINRHGILLMVAVLGLLPMIPGFRYDHELVKTFSKTARTPVVLSGRRVRSEPPEKKDPKLEGMELLQIAYKFALNLTILPEELGAAVPSEDDPFPLSNFDMFLMGVRMRPFALIFFFLVLGEITSMGEMFISFLGGTGYGNSLPIPCAVDDNLWGALVNGSTTYFPYGTTDVEVQYKLHLGVVGITTFTCAIAVTDVLFAVFGFWLLIGSGYILIRMHWLQEGFDRSINPTWENPLFKSKLGSKMPKLEVSQVKGALRSALEEAKLERGG